MRVFGQKGVWVRSKKGHGAVVDPARKPDGLAVVSHAHSDHTGFGTTGASVLTTPETASLLGPKFARANVQTVPFKRPVEMGDVTLTLHPAGHVLGSAQALFEGDRRVVVSGDLQTRDSLLFDAAKPLDADTLVLETTFGRPGFSFPPREEVYAQIGEWVNQNARAGALCVLCGYALGKAQELTRVVNDYSDYVPLVHEQVFAYNETYRKSGVALGDYGKVNGNLRDASVLILPPSLVERHFAHALSASAKKPVRTAVATGWPRRPPFERVFPLSDHADFDDLTQYVREARPRTVLTYHGFDAAFARHLSRRLRVHARPLSLSRGQQALAEYV